MKIKLNTQLLNEDSDILHDYSLKDALQKTIDDANAGKITTVKEFVESINKYKGPPATVGIIFRRALLNRLVEEEIEADEAQRRFNVASKMMDAEEFDLAEKDRDIIKKNITKSQSIVVIGQIMNILNPPVEEKKSPRKKGNE